MAFWILHGNGARRRTLEPGSGPGEGSESLGSPQGCAAGSAMPAPSPPSLPKKVLPQLGKGEPQNGWLSPLAMPSPPRLLGGWSGGEEEPLPARPHPGRPCASQLQRPAATTLCAVNGWRIELKWLEPRAQSGNTASHPWGHAMPENTPLISMTIPWGGAVGEKRSWRRRRRRS